MYVRNKSLDGVVDTIGGALKAADQILRDPALPEVTSLVLQLHALEPKNPKTGQPSPGIGLRTVVRPLRAYVAVKKNPILGYAAVAGILAIPFILGRLSKR